MLHVLYMVILNCIYFRPNLMYKTKTKSYNLNRLDFILQRVINKENI